MKDHEFGKDAAGVDHEFSGTPGAALEYWKPTGSHGNKTHRGSPVDEGIGAIAADAAHSAKNHGLPAIPHKVHLA
jgi:hypothetical protein